MSTLEEPAPAGLEIAMTDDRDAIRRQVVDRIRDLHRQAGGLSRIHRTHPALYARARRAFGSWRSAVAEAGLDYSHELSRSLRRGLEMRDQRRALWSALSRWLLEQASPDDATLARTRPELAGRVRRCWGGLAQAIEWAGNHRARGSAGGASPEPAHAVSEG
jgi:hypothetical protein